MLTRVVKIGTARYDEYIGRPKGQNQMHFGNPFGLPGSKVATVIVATRREAMEACWAWLEGTDYPSIPNIKEIEPERRLWILDNLESLRGKILGCFCKPHACHGDIYRAFLGEITKEEALYPKQPEEIQHDFFGEPKPYDAIPKLAAEEGPGISEPLHDRPSLEGQLDLFG